MDHKMTEDGDWIRHLYVYYPVPNGCYEYCIECGERNSLTGEEVSAAYYHIFNEDEVHSEPSAEEDTGNKDDAPAAENELEVTEESKDDATEESSEENDEASLEEPQKDTSEAASDSSSN